MFKITKLVAVALLALGGTAMAQESQENEIKKVSKAIDFYKTAPVRSFPKAPVTLEDVGEAYDGRHSSKRQKIVDHLKQAGESPTSIDPLIQTKPASRVSREPIISFDGINVNVSPPDPSAAVGPNHVVQMTNGRWTVFDKEGNIADGFPKLISDPLGGAVSGNSADPIVLYDREADRWVITKFDLHSGASAADRNNFRIAVSRHQTPLDHILCIISKEEILESQIMII